MAKAFDTWTVLDHGPLQALGDNVWRVEGAVPHMQLKRQMIVVRLADGQRLLVHNPIALVESNMAELERHGEPAFIVVPNGWHRLDSASFKRRYPRAQVFCPRGARRKVEQVVPVDGTYEQFAADAAATLRHVEGIGELEGVLQARSSDGITLVFNDLLFNVPHQAGLFGLVFRLLGSTGGPRVTRIMRLLAVKNRPALRRDLEELAATPELRRLVPGHGDVIEGDAAAILRGVAAGL